MTISTETLQSGLSRTLLKTEFEGLGKRYEGKVRDNYSTTDGRRIIVTTDRISAFDRVLGTLPFKGQVLNQAACWWFEQTRSVAPNHLLENPDPNVMVCVDCEPLPVEAVVRGYLTGVSSTSILTAYEKGAREFCGHTLPDGMRRHQKLPKAILTPSTKAQKGDHDQSVSREQILATGRLTAAEFDQVAEYAMALFALGQKLCAARGLILVDTKYEFGKTPDGRIVLIDEIHTPDSSRFWFSNTYEERMAAGKDPESFDKEYLRRWLVEQGFRGDGPIPHIPDEIRVESARRYIEACDTIRGASFTPNLEPPLERIKKNLGLI
ncbi:MAG: phosphoribosylaminoimidazolesuccinocarboxamide synthase [Deltaproteobacteria bacterium]|nr:phosphoribosylaminoimidazolesuccinocarboxamide synthase [Deltaproteobacteria bacterium]